MNKGEGVKEERVGERKERGEEKKSLRSHGYIKSLLSFSHFITNVFLIHIKSNFTWPYCRSRSLY